MHAGVINTEALAEQNAEAMSKYSEERRLVQHNSLNVNRVADEALLIPKIDRHSTSCDTSIIDPTLGLGEDLNYARRSETRAKKFHERVY